MTLEERICDLVDRSLQDNQLKEEIRFEISQKSIDIAWKYYFIDIRKHTCIIHSDEIRHVLKEHGDEVYHICKIPEYLETISGLERSSSWDKEAGKEVPCFVFTKRKNNKKIKMVKLNISRHKVLRLKTLYEA